jgi:WD and tetratricopeptide repeat-containing protein 1
MYGPAGFRGVCLAQSVTGSDDGRVFIYAAKSGAPIIALEADEDVANCVTAHPSLPVLATSGIESVVRLWSPNGPAAWPDIRKDIVANQARAPFRA